MRLIREGIFKIEEVLPFVSMEPAKHGRNAVNERPQREYNGKMVHMDSLRYQTFVKSGTVCVSCGLQAEYFALEQHVNPKKPIREERFHLNLYATTSAIREIMFTKDHILPRARGGGNGLDNMQTMCQPCNTAKGHITEFQLDPSLRRTGRTSRSRVKRLKHKVLKELANIKEERKQHYQPGSSDGGPVFQQYKKRRVQLQKRLDLLNLIDGSLLRRLRKYRRKTYKRKQEDISEYRMRIQRLRLKIEEEIKENKEERANHYIPGTADGGPIFVIFRNRHKHLTQRIKRLTKLAQRAKQEAKLDAHMTAIGLTVEKANESE
jgi:HNH endonuclease